MLLLTSIGDSPPSSLANNGELKDEWIFMCSWGFSVRFIGSLKLIVNASDPSEPSSIYCPTKMLLLISLGYGLFTIWISLLVVNNS